MDPHKAAAAAAAAAPKMDPRMQGFLGNMGVKRGITLKAAAEWCIAFCMADPENSDLLPPGTSLSLEDEARREWLHRYNAASETKPVVQPSTKVRPARPPQESPAPVSPAAPEPAEQVVASTPAKKKPAVVKKDKPVTPSPAVTTSVTDATFIRSKPSQIRIGDAVHEVTTWRAVYVHLATALVDTGKGSTIPAIYFKAEDKGAKRTAKLADGRFLYVNLTADQVLPRIRTLREALGVPVITQFQSEDGVGPREMEL